MKTLAAVVACGWVLAGCAVAAPGATTPTGPTVVSATAGVEFYPACGNETLNFGGTTYYPLFGDEEDALDTGVYPSAEPNADAAGLSSGSVGGGVGGGPGVVGMVAAPGPGDDTGTLVVYSDGYAYWVSDSGDLDVWLNDQVHEYGWVC